MKRGWVVERGLEELSLKRICASRVTKKIIRFFGGKQKSPPQDNPGSATGSSRVHRTRSLSAMDHVRWVAESSTFGAVIANKVK